ncbi:MAG: DUF11 domain-containing protein, partial [Acidobacteria bacterium]|nr:DUF11 domain-containing protein [Acidobacteriota bacterium]
MTTDSGEPDAAGSQPSTAYRRGERLAALGAKVVNVPGETVVEPVEPGTNLAAVSGNEPDPDGSNNSATEDTEVLLAADLALTKADDPDPAVAGGTLTYTLTVTNNGPSGAPNVVVVDTLAAGVTFVSGVGCTEAGGVVTCAVGTVLVGVDQIVSFTVVLDPSLAEGAVLTNNATVSGDVVDETAANDSDSEFTTVTREADLSVAKTDSPDPAIAGGQLTYTITVTNLGPSDASGVTVTDTLPAAVTFVSSTPGSPDCTHSAGVVTCTLGDIAAGDSATVTITVTTDPSLAEGATITNTASAVATELDPVTVNDSVTEDTRITREADLSVTKTDSPDPVVAGETLTYTITVTNLGPSDASGVTVTDLLPAEATFVSSTPGSPDCAHSAGVVTCDLGGIAAGDSATVTITVTTDPSLAEGATITNTASAAATEPDPATANDSVTEDTTITREADLSIAKSDDIDPAIAGGPLTYTITVTNLGPSDASGVTVTDTLPAGTTFVSGVGCTVASGVVTCDLGDIAVGANATATITVTTDPSLAEGATITNQASAAATELDPVSANDTTTEDTGIIRQADISVAKTHDPEPAVAGAEFTYTITVSNNGPSDASNIVIQDTLPAEATFVSGSPNCTELNGVVTCNLGDVAAGGTAVATITVSTGPSLVEGTIIANGVTAGADEPDPESANDTATDDTTITRVSDLELTKTDTPDPVVAGAELTYTIGVTNLGPSDSTGITVVDTLPPGTTFVTSTPGPPACSEASGVVTCNLGDLALGQSTQMTITIAVGSSATGSIFNLAVVTANESDSELANNADHETTAIAAEADLAITKTDDPDPVIAGDVLTYTLTVTNNEPSGATGVTVVDILPHGIT